RGDGIQLGAAIDASREKRYERVAVSRSGIHHRPAIGCPYGIVSVPFKREARQGALVQIVDPDVTSRPAGDVHRQFRSIGGETRAVADSAGVCQDLFPSAAVHQGEMVGPGGGDVDQRPPTEGALALTVPAAHAEADASLQLNQFTVDSSLLHIERDGVQGGSDLDQKLTVGVHDVVNAVGQALNRFPLAGPLVQPFGMTAADVTEGDDGPIWQHGGDSWEAKGANHASRSA